MGLTALWVGGGGKPPGLVVLRLLLLVLLLLLLPLLLLRPVQGVCRLHPPTKQQVPFSHSIYFRLTDRGRRNRIQTASHRYRGKGPQGTIALAFFLSCGGGLLRIRQTERGREEVGSRQLAAGWGYLPRLRSLPPHTRLSTPHNRPSTPHTT